MERNKVFDEIIDDLFAEHLPPSKSEWYGKFVDSKDIKRWAVVGFDYEKAQQIMESIEQDCEKEVLRKSRSKYNLWFEFKDGTILQWVKAHESSRMYRFNKMWCDKNIDKDIFNHVIRPCYQGKREDIIWL